MALQLNLADSTVGLAAPSAYAKITGMIFDAPTNRIEVQVAIYASAEARHTEKAPMERKTIIGTVGYSPGCLDLETALAEGWRAAIYAWLKTQPYFSGALDLLDTPVAPKLAGLFLNDTSLTVELDDITLRDEPLTVMLSSDATEIVVAPSVVIASGLARAVVPVTKTPVTENKTATITATLGEVTKTVAIHFTVPPPPVEELPPEQP